ncbi:MAG: Thiosulfate sulfurtransferase PspE precursor [Bacteroidetes bacterium ADurb.Bin416]|nr:MAG: Thiosulfate sulfurtransferase PspE precursor [Bacteroidetes bacterium ADurb.Bin416]
MAVFQGMTIHDLAHVDFAYSPPLGTANDAINMAAFVAENRLSGYSPSLLAEELDSFVAEKQPTVIDVRDVFAFEKAHMVGAKNIPLELLSETLATWPQDKTYLVYDETGKKGHQALRWMRGAGFEHVVNISGGHASVQRHAHAIPFSQFQVKQAPIEDKTLESEGKGIEATPQAPLATTTGPLVVDVRTPMEFAGGAYPGAVNIPLDELEERLPELGPKDRDITLYCASGARSGYAVQVLAQQGYLHVKNGGGLMHMMMRRT